MTARDRVVDWLLEEDNPGVRVWASTCLCGYPQDHEQVRAVCQAVTQTLPAARDLSWLELKGQIVVYSLTALKVQVSAEELHPGCHARAAAGRGAGQARARPYACLACEKRARL